MGRDLSLSAGRGLSDRRADPVPDRAGGQTDDEGRTVTSNPCSAVAGSFRHRHEAEMARGYLRASGIPSALLVDDAGGAYAGLALGTGTARVLVRHEDLQRARRVLRDAGMTQSAGGS